jgi:PAS domain S-box-containing protein
MSHRDACPPSGKSDRALLGSYADPIEARFRRIEQNLPCVIYEYESDETGIGRFLYLTPQWLALTEVTVDLTIADVNVALGLIHPEDLGEFLQRQEQAARTLSVLRINMRILTPSGKIKWVSLSSSPKEKDTQGLILWNGVIVDVSDAKLAEEDLRSSRTRFERMAATVPSGLYEYVMFADGSSKYLYLSARAEEIYEVRPGELLQDINVLWDMVHPDDLVALRQADVGCNKKGELFVSEFRIIPRSGKTKWVRIASLPNPTPPGQPAVWSGYIIDITDQKLIEQKVKSSETRLRQTLDHSPIAIARASLGVNPKIRYLNQQFIHTFGYTLADIPTIEQWGQRAYPDPEYREQVFDEWNDAVERGQKGDGIVEPREFRVVCKGNVTRNVLIGATLLDDTMIVTLQDITDRKQAEAELARAKDELTRREIERSVLDERERLIEDMHDGFGSQLTSARLQMEEGQLHQDQLVQLLRECMADLHMVVDTLGNEDGLLKEAFHHFRQRSQIRLAEQPFSLEWTLQLDDLPRQPPRQILNILRIVQEALNNAIKHARANTIGVRAIHHGHHRLSIEVYDDGLGFPEGVVPGKGLHNLRTRAQSLGADLQFIDMDPGLKVALQFSLHPNAA